MTYIKEELKGLSQKENEINEKLTDSENQQNDCYEKLNKM